MTFGEKLRLSRKQKGYTQRDLARLIGARHNSVSNWENNQNKPDSDTIERLCQVLDVSPNYLFRENSTSFDQTEISELSQEELRLLTCFQKLDAHGKELLLLVAEKERERIRSEESPFLELSPVARGNSQDRQLKIIPFDARTAAGLQEGDDF